jgi:hypothetical protein
MVFLLPEAGDVGSTATKMENGYLGMEAPLAFDLTEVRGARQRIRRLMRNQGWTRHDLQVRCRLVRTLRNEAQGIHGDCGTSVSVYCIRKYGT